MRASQLAHANTIIRFIGYKPRPGISEEQFIAVWRTTVEQGSQPAGLIYRELCQQVPEWNTQIVAEIQNANPYAFIDYAILWPDQDPAELPLLPAEISAQYEIVDELFTIAHPFIKPDLAGEPETIFWNCFEVNPAVEQGFVLGWPTRAEYQSQQEGFFSALLHRHIRPNARISAFNRAEWQNASAYASTIAEFDRKFPVQGRMGGPGPAKPQGGPPPVKSYLGLYRIVGRFQQPSPRILPKMHAVVMRGYGGPEVLHYEEIDRPVPGPGQLLLRVHAAGINPLDVKMRSGDVKTIHPTWPTDILGYDLAGVIEAIGPGVTDRTIGEKVYGSSSPFMRRAYADYAVVPASAFKPMPRQVSFIQAAAVPSSVHTAHNALFTMANLQAQQRVLIHGASGSVGSFAVQLAKQAGAYVIGTASTAKCDYVLGLGADEVIDYQTQMFEELVSDIDVVLDTIGGETRARSWGVLKQGATLITLVPPLPDQTLAASHAVRAVMNQNASNESNFLSQVTQMIETGQLRLPEVGRVLPLQEAQQAHTLFAQGKVSGRIILAVK